MKDILEKIPLPPLHKERELKQSLYKKSLSCKERDLG
jgi:hypothetical protein